MELQNGCLWLELTDFGKEFYYRIYRSTRNDRIHTGWYSLRICRFYFIFEIKKAHSLLYIPF